jgi:hypothetical protein
MDYNVTNSHGTPDMAIEMAKIAEDREATRPLMDWLFTRTYDYPLPYSGIADYMISGTTRDGTTTIGSFSYTASGTPFLGVAASTSAYIKNGGDKSYDLADPAQYPKPFAAAYFNLDARQGRRLGRVDGPDFGMREGRAQHRHVQLALGVDIVDIGAGAGQEAMVLAARIGVAETGTRHGQPPHTRLRW